MKKSTNETEQKEGISRIVPWLLYIIFFGIGSIMFGKLCDLYSPKYLMIIGIAVYVVFSRKASSKRQGAEAEKVRLVDLQTELE